MPFEVRFTEAPKTTINATKVEYDHDTGLFTFSDSNGKSTALVPAHNVISVIRQESEGADA